MKYKNKIWVKKFNSKTKRIKHFNLEKLAKPTADFVKHINFVLNGTPYGIGSIEEEVYSGINEKRKNDMIITLSLYKLHEKPQEYGDSVLDIHLKAWMRRGPKIHLTDLSDDGYFSKSYGEKIKNYDLSKIENWLNQKFK